MSTMYDLAGSLLRSSLGARAFASYDALRTSYLDPYILAPLMAVVDSPPSLANILMLLIILWLSLRILDYARRIIVFWVALVFRIVFWTALIGGVCYVYHFGFEESVRVVNDGAAYMRQSVEELLVGDDKSAKSRGGSSWW